MELITVELGASFVDLPPIEQRLAIAQIVLTLTGLRGIGQVVFTRDREVTGVPLPDGILTSAPVAAEDFESLLEVPVSTTTAATTTPTTSTTSTTVSARRRVKSRRTH